uniref:Cuticle collagen 39-like n=1 Tax=Phascolarctos cinereus TaxID=38626 RepID=A0A6P5JVQ2_PHACI|nr:cuticle collagen 39-like [Phascolarctos cinereus]
MRERPMWRLLCRGSGGPASSSGVRAAREPPWQPGEDGLRGGPGADCGSTACPGRSEPPNGAGGLGEGGREGTALPREEPPDWPAEGKVDSENGLQKRAMEEH